MPKYFFHLRARFPFQDDGGADLPDDNSAWVEATRFARDIEGNLRPGDTWHLEIHRDGRAIYSLKICGRAIE